MKAIYRIMETKDSWVFQDKEGNFLYEINMFGGAEVVELLKEDYFDLQAAEEIEKRFNVEVWKDFPVDEEELELEFETMLRGI